MSFTTIKAEVIKAAEFPFYGLIEFYSIGARGSSGKGDGGDYLYGTSGYRRRYWDGRTGRGSGSSPSLGGTAGVKGLKVGSKTIVFLDQLFEG